MPILEGGPEELLFKRDGQPPHFQQEVVYFLNSKFPEQWFGINIT
jgi:hypothetical protein